MTNHPEQQINEVYLGNTIGKAMIGGDKVIHLKSLRVGERAFDLNGQPIHQSSNFQPVFISKQEFPEFDRIMSDLHGCKLRKIQFTPQTA